MTIDEVLEELNKKHPPQSEPVYKHREQALFCQGYDFAIYVVKKLSNREKGNYGNHTK